MSRQAAARRFALPASTVINWVSRFRALGHVEPGQIGGQKPKAISGEHRSWAMARCKRADFTLRGLVAEFAAERGLKVDYHSVWDFVHGEGLSFKKNTSARRAGSPGRAKTARAMAALPKAD